LGQPAQQRQPQALTDQGYHIIHWSDGDLTYWAASDLNEVELREFVDTDAGSTRHIIARKARPPGVARRHTRCGAGGCNKTVTDLGSCTNTS
jgi:hypothetical protein